jgi:hypothetical protein
MRERDFDSGIPASHNEVHPVHPRGFDIDQHLTGTDRRFRKICNMDKLVHSTMFIESNGVHS